MEITYKGWRAKNIGGPMTVYRIRKDGERTILDPGPSQKLRNHSPDGFQWGYGGSGPAQLSLALLLDATGAPAPALHWYQTFKRIAVAGWGDEWEISRQDILLWIMREVESRRKPI